MSHPRSTCCSTASTFFFWLLLSLMGRAASASNLTSDRVLVIRNGDSPISIAIADDYIRERAVKHVLTIHCKDSSISKQEAPQPDKFPQNYIGTKVETIDVNFYRRDIETPVRAYLATHPEIDFIVLTKGVPIRIQGAGEPGGIDRFSLDSHLAALGYDTLSHAIRVNIVEKSYDPSWLKHFHRRFRAHVWANQFWNSIQPFSHARFGGYLVTRLDGFTETDAIALTHRCLEAEQLVSRGNRPRGEILLDVAPEYGKATPQYSILSESRSQPQRSLTITSERAHLADFNSDMELTADLLAARSIPVELDQSGHFVDNRSGLMGYVSWGSNDTHFSSSAYHSLRFQPGAIAETAVSTSARTFLPTTGGQSLIADLISQGVTGVKGYVDEPLVQAVAEPSILFDRYTRGWTLAESFYAASALVGWEDVVVGDPICRAYPNVRSEITENNQ